LAAALLKALYETSETGDDFKVIGGGHSANAGLYRLDSKAKNLMPHCLDG
jgi:hypothetical protein